MSGSYLQFWFLSQSAAVPLKLGAMALGSVDQLSDDDVPGAERGTKDGDTSAPSHASPKAEAKAKGASKAKAKAKVEKKTKEPKVKSKTKPPPLKRPAAASGTSTAAPCKRPASEKDPDRVTAGKGLYKNGTWGIKLNGKQVLLVT